MKDEKLRSAELLYERPIPLEVSSIAGWKEVPIVESSSVEQLVPLGPFSAHHEIFTSSAYFGEHSNSPYQNGVEGSLLTIFARERVAEQLQLAQQSLPEQLHLVVFDAYRPLEVQRALYNTYFNELRIQHPDWTDGALSEETQKYCSLPQSPKLNPHTTFVSPHNTGGAVDIAVFQLPKEIDLRIQAIDQQIRELGLDETEWKQIYLLQMKKIGLINRNAQMLNFGTPFDWGGPEAAISYLEKKAQGQRLTGEEREAQRNRRLLYNVMMDAGFQAYPDEWWHFNSAKSQMGARAAGYKVAEYGSIDLNADNQLHESVRKSHRNGSIQFFEGSATEAVMNNEFFAAAQEGIHEIGDIRLISLPLVHVIKPSPIV